jgi:hypothetical protein
MLKRYGHKPLEESAIRADELAAAGDHEGAAIWRRITAAVSSSRTTSRPDRSTDRNGPATTNWRPLPLPANLTHDNV